MRPNPVKEKLQKGGVAIGTFAMEFATPGLMQICKAAGAEFAFIDMEHSGLGINDIKQQMAYARGVGIVPMVRVPAAQYHFIARVLDAGAMGVMVPMVETVEQAQLIVQSTRYPPKGRRGAVFGGSHDDYTGGDIVAKMQGVHARTFVVCQIETERGLENVDAIVGTDGVDCGWIGHFDLSNFLGVPAQFQSAKFIEARARVAAVCKKHGKAAGVMPADVAMARDWYAAGFNILAFGSDIGLFQHALSTRIVDFKAAEKMG
jgi:2-keto-3-deoxy-L-rhamnonate aldolase RhmA